MTARDVPAPRSGLSVPSDEDALVAAVRTGDEAALRELMGRLNRRLFRIARALVGDDAEAEEVVQETWLAALAHLDRFRGEARFATRPGQIRLDAARMRRRAERRRGGEGPVPGDGERMGAQVLPFPGRSGETPEEAAERRQVRRLPGRQWTNGRRSCGWCSCCTRWRVWTCGPSPASCRCTR